MELENQTKHHLTSHSSQLQLVSEVCQVALEHIWLECVHEIQPHWGQISCAETYYLENSVPQFVSTHFAKLVEALLESKLVSPGKWNTHKQTSCLLQWHETQQREQNKDVKTPDRQEFSPSPGWNVQRIRELLCLDVYSWPPDKEKYFAATCKWEGVFEGIELQSSMATEDLILFRMQPIKQ